MLDNLISLVKQHAGQAIIDNPAIPNKRNDEAVASASNSILESLKNAVSGGGLQDILGMFGGRRAASNRLINDAKNNFAGKLARNFGLDAGQAGSVAESVIPGAMSSLVNKTNDPGDSSFDFQDIMGRLSGRSGAGIDFGGLMSKFRSGAFDADGDGDTDLQDAVKMLGGRGEGGGILGKIKGMFGK